jgi:hypothetical protein
MKRFVLAIVGLAAAVGGAGYVTHPDEFKQFTDASGVAATRLGDSIAANPMPVALALGTFLLTVVYHKLKGKSLRESVEAAATRVTVVTAPPVAPQPVTTPPEDESPVVQRAKARATRMQLLSDQIGLQNKQKWLPEAIQNAEKDASYTEQAMIDATKALKAKERAHDEAVTKLLKLREQKRNGDKELGEIEAELVKLADRV